MNNFKHTSVEVSDTPNIMINQGLYLSPDNSYTVCIKIKATHVFNIILQTVERWSVTTFGRKDFLHDSVNSSEISKRFQDILFKLEGCLLRKVE